MPYPALPCPGLCTGMVVGGVTYSAVRVETRLKLPRPGPGLWPAFWLLSRDNKCVPWGVQLGLYCWFVLLMLWGTVCGV